MFPPLNWAAIGASIKAFGVAIGDLIKDLFAFIWPG